MFNQPEKNQFALILLLLLKVKQFLAHYPLSLAHRKKILRSEDERQGVCRPISRRLSALTLFMERWDRGAI